MSSKKKKLKKNYKQTFDWTFAFYCSTGTDLIPHKGCARRVAQQKSLETWKETKSKKQKAKLQAATS
jgi:hypothetical protein